MPRYTPGGDGAGVTPDTWCVVVVRAWVEDGRLTVRLIASGDCGDRTVVVTSIDAAGRELAGVLAAITTSSVDDDGDDSGRTRS